MHEASGESGNSRRKDRFRLYSAANVLTKTLSLSWKSIAYDHLHRYLLLWRSHFASQILFRPSSIQLLLYHSQQNHAVSSIASHRTAKHCCDRVSSSNTHHLQTPIHHKNCYAFEAACRIHELA